MYKGHAIGKEGQCQQGAHGQQAEAEGGVGSVVLAVEGTLGQQAAANGTAPQTMKDTMMLMQSP